MNAAPEIDLSKEPAASVRATSPPHSSPLKAVVRVALFLWALLIACPVRYWPIDDTIDNTWVFALNYAVPRTDLRSAGTSCGPPGPWVTWCSRKISAPTSRMR